MLTQRLFCAYSKPDLMPGSGVSQMSEAQFVLYIGSSRTSGEADMREYKMQFQTALKKISVS